MASIMSSSLLSQPEREFITGGVKLNYRADGRTCNDYRTFSVETGVVSNTSGSAKVQLDRTAAIVGVKAELGTPLTTAPDRGRVEFYVDCSGLAGPEFGSREGEELGAHLTRRLSEAYSNPFAVDLTSLAVIPGTQCWILYVDALVLEWGGNILDALSLGVWAALSATLIPKLIVTGEGAEMEIEVSDNPHDSTRLSMGNAPIIITLTQVGGEFVVDASSQEEACSSLQLSLAVNKKGHVTSTNKEGHRGLPYHKISDVFTMGVDVSRIVFKSLESQLEKQLSSI